MFRERLQQARTFLGIQLKRSLSRGCVFRIFGAGDQSAGSQSLTRMAITIFGEIGVIIISCQSINGRIGIFINQFNSIKSFSCKRPCNIWSDIINGWNRLLNIFYRHILGCFLDNSLFPIGGNPKHLLFGGSKDKHLSIFSLRNDSVSSFSLTMFTSSTLFGISFQCGKKPEL